MKIAVVTACGNKKSIRPAPAFLLYKSPRIKAVFNRKGDNDMFILSAKHGLIPAGKIISPYNQIIDKQRSRELIPEIRNDIQNYNAIVFFKAGARNLYEKCLKEACRLENVKFLSFGYGFMGGINDLPKKIEFVQKLN